MGGVLLRTGAGAGAGSAGTSVDWSSVAATSTDWSIDRPPPPPPEAMSATCRRAAASSAFCSSSFLSRAAFFSACCAQDQQVPSETLASTSNRGTGISRRAAYLSLHPLALCQLGGLGVLRKAEEGGAGNAVEQASGSPCYCVLFL